MKELSVWNGLDLKVTKRQLMGQEMMAGEGVEPPFRLTVPERITR
jgi:hypothetical protein